MGQRYADEGKIHHQLHPVPLTLGVFACTMTLLQHRRYLRRQPQLLPVQVEGQASQCRRCCHTTVVTPCSSSADCPAAGVFASRCRVVVEVSLLLVLRFCLGQRETDDWKIHRLLFPVPRGRCVGLLNGWFSSIDVICPDNHNYFQFKLKGNCRSGAATQVVDVPVVQLHRCCSWRDVMSFWAVVDVPVVWGMRGCSSTR